MLKIRLLPAEEANLSTRGTESVEAYNDFLKGRYHFNRREPTEAIAEFERALARDPGYVDAYTGLADAYCIYGFYGGIPTLDAFARARASAEKARQLDPDSADAHISLGIVELATFRPFHSFHAIAVRHGELHLERSLTGHLNLTDYIDAVPEVRKREISAGAYQVNVISFTDLAIHYVEHVAGYSGSGSFVAADASVKTTMPAMNTVRRPSLSPIEPPTSTRDPRKSR